MRMQIHTMILYQMKVDNIILGAFCSGGRHPVQGPLDQGIRF